MSEFLSLFLISIHALRMEGDSMISPQAVAYLISIHALRMEGDEAPVGYDIMVGDFNPRPPHGGRLKRRIANA